MRAMEAAAVPEGPLFGTRLFVCANIWVLRHSRSLNEFEGPQGDRDRGPWGSEWGDSRL